MMVVLALIGLVAAVVVPRTGVLDGVELRSEARNLAGAIRITYSTAAMDKVPYRICFNLEQQLYTVQKKAGDEYKEVTDPLMAPRVMPGKVYIKAVKVMDRECSSYCKEYLYFAPGGYVEEASIYLSLEDAEQTISVFTKPMTGKAVIVMEELTRKEWERESEY